MPQKKIKIGNLLFPKKTLLKIIAVFLLLAILNNLILKFVNSNSVLILIPANIILGLVFLNSIKKEVSQVKPE